MLEHRVGEATGVERGGEREESRVAARVVVEGWPHPASVPSAMVIW
jgi:hypothetical protein